MAFNPTALYVRDNSTVNPATFVGSQAANTTLNVTSLLAGALAVGMFYVSSNTTIQGVINGGTGPSTYTSSSSSNIAGGTTLTAVSALTPGTVGWSALPGWLPGHAYTPGQLIRQSANGAVFTGSTTGSSTTVAVSSITSGKLVVGQTLYYTSGLSPVITAVNGDPATSITINSAITLASQMVVATFPMLNQRVFVCTTGGTSQALEPSWAVTRGAKTTETGGVVWMEVSGHPALNGDTANSGTWVAATGPGLGAVIVDAAKANVFVCTTGGTTKTGAEPAWNTAVGGTTLDGTVTWTCIGPVSNFSAWGAPFANLYYAYAGGYGAAGQMVFVAGDHNELVYGNLIYGAMAGTPALPSQVMSVNPASAPPTALQPGATHGTIGPWSLTMNSTAGWYFNGMTIQSGSGGGAITLSISANKLVMEGCTLAKTSVGASASAITIASGDILLNNPTFRLGNVGDRVSITGKTRIQNMVTPLAGSIVPNIMFGPGVNNALVEIDGSDFAALGSGQIINATGWTVLNGCKLGSATVVTSTPTAAQRVDLINCDSAATNYIKSRYENAGTQTADTAVVRTTGEVIEATHVSDKIVVNANTSWVNHFPVLPIMVENATVGSAVTATLYGVFNGAALPLNDEVWLEAEYPSSTSSSITSTVTSTKSSPLVAGSAITADTSAWDSSAALRTNSAAFTVGQTLKVASNPDRIFICTTAGTTAGTEPAGYATAVDGGSVTDGGAVFRVGMRFRTAVTFTPRIAGPIFVRPKVGKVSGVTSTYYLDRPVLS